LRRFFQLAAVAALVAAALFWGAASLTSDPASATTTTRSGIRETQTGSYLAARHAESESALSEAADHMAATLKADPDNVEVLRRTILLLVSSGRTTEAVPLARRMAQIDSNALVPSLLLVAEEMKRQDPAAARAVLNRMSRESFAGVAAPILSAWVALAEKGPDEAVRELKALSAAPPLRIMERLHAGLINEAAGRPKEAREAYEGALQPGAKVPFRVLEALAAIIQRGGDQDAARAIFRTHPPDNPDAPLIQAIIARLGDAEPYPPIVRTPADGVAEAFFDLATSLFRQSENNMALVLGRLALHARPDFPLGHFFVAEIFEGMKKYEESMALYEDVDKAASFSWEARLRAAGNLADLKRTDEALSRLDAMAKERPERADVLFRKANILREKERYSEAVAAYDGAIARLGPMEPGHWSFYYARGMALERAKDFTRAEEDLGRALELRPEQPYVLNYLAYMWIDQGLNLDRARDMIKRAADLRPDDGYIVDSLGWFYFRTGDFERAVQHLERAVELRAADPVINDHLGDAYWQAGRFTEARYQWWRALNFEAPADMADKIRVKLDRGLGAIPAANKG
jgi:tetratricopeptide (TPR) repeat protein